MSHAEALLAIIQARRAKQQRIRQKWDRRVTIMDLAETQVERSAGILSASVMEIAEAQAALDRALLARLRERDAPKPVRTINLAIRPKRKRRR